MTREDKTPKQFGPWLRASAGGWRTKQQNQNKDGRGEGSNKQLRHSNHMEVIHSEILMAKLAELTANDVSSGKELHPGNVGERSNKAYSKEREGDTADNSTGKQ